VFVSPANKNLRDTLVRLNLCSDRDFRRCRRIVRRLARGIPAFDFVWIDALVQFGSLTPYQAKVLQSAPPEQLRLGPCVLLDRLGAGLDSETFRARTLDGQIVALKRVRVADNESAAAAALSDLIEKSRGLDSPFIVAPGALLDQAGRLVVMSRYVAGPSCKELLVRRGRFGAQVVVEIARQLAYGCATLEGRGQLHGQIRLDNVRVTPAGNAVLVDGGIGSALDRGVLVRDDVPPAAYDATAPERIGTGSPPSTTSEIYAFGCLLWELLAGRPPFPTGDPLAKLAAHQSRGVPDVRTIAPDTPANLAEAVRACTHADPKQRPPTFAGIARRFGPPVPSGRQRLARFLRRFDSAAPADQLTPERPARFPVTAVALVVFVLSAAGFFLVQHGATAELLRRNDGSSSKIADVVRRAPDTSDPRASARTKTAEAVPREGGIEQASYVREGEPRSALQPLPSPDADGVIRLGDGSYEAGSVSCVGDLIIRGTGTKPAMIYVSERPFQASCRKFAMEHIVIRVESQSALPALMAIRSQELAISDCAFVSASGARDDTGDAVAWTAAAARDPDAGRIRLTNTVFSTGRNAVRFATPPTRIEIDNCLKVGGRLLDFDERSSDHAITVSAKHVTLRRAACFCRMSRSSARAATGHLRLLLRDSAFDLAGRGAALIELVSAAEPTTLGRSILIGGSGSVIRPDVAAVGWSRPGSATVTPLDSRGLVVEGLAVGDFQFVGSDAAAASASASSIDLGSLAIPRNSDEPPGFVAARLDGRPQSALR
jgi:serine/threonine protein kinase